jgi:hypothetical protein
MAAEISTLALRRRTPDSTARVDGWARVLPPPGLLFGSSVSRVPETQQLEQFTDLMFDLRGKEETRADWR